jgi:hypothetical protein
MPRQPNDPHRDSAAQPRDDDIEVDLVELFASRPQGVDEFFADPAVGMRIGMLITGAMNKPARR